MSEPKVLTEQLPKIAVALIIFRRPQTTQRVLAAIKTYGPKKLYVIADGPRPAKSGESELVELTRGLIDSAGIECEIVKIYSARNLGLRNRVLSGLDQVFETENEVIVLEDDCLPNQDFFRFSQELLERYKSSKTVGLISGNNFASDSHIQTSYYFSKHAYIWGWATWARTWREFRSTTMEDFLEESAKVQIARAIPSRFQRVSFLSQVRNAKDLDSWAIQFAAYCYLKGRLSALPRVNLVSNIGFGAESTHTKFESYADQVQAESLYFPLSHPESVTPNLREMRRESRYKLRRWLIYPLAHPLDFIGRVIRYLRLRGS